MNRKTIFKYKKVNNYLHQVITKSGKVIGEMLQDPADGYFYFFLNEFYNGGAFSSEILFELSNKLNKLNYVHNNKINKYFDEKENQ